MSSEGQSSPGGVLTEFDPLSPSHCGKEQQGAALQTSEANDIMNAAAVGLLASTGEKDVRMADYKIADSSAEAPNACNQPDVIQTVQVEAPPPDLTAAVVDSSSTINTDSPAKGSSQTLDNSSSKDSIPISDGSKPNILSGTSPDIVPSAMPSAEASVRVMSLQDQQQPVVAMPSVQPTSDQRPQVASPNESLSRQKSKKKKKKKQKRSSISAPDRDGLSGKGSTLSEETISSQMNEIDAFLQSLKVGGGLAGLAGVGMPSAVGGALPAVGYTAGFQTAQVGMATPSVQTSSSAASMQAPASQPPVNQGTGMGLGLIQTLRSDSSSDDSSSSESDESSSDSSSEEDDNFSRRLKIVEEQDSAEENETVKKYGHMSKGEIHYKDLPPLDSCDMEFPQGGELLPVGVVSHITEELVIVQGLPEAPPVDEGTVLWSEDKTSLSMVFEIFGPVKSPYYSVHVRSPEHAQKLGLTAGRKVFVVRNNQELTKYIFTQRLLQQRGSDASWKDNAEVPDNFQDFSDDEAERSYRKAGKRRNRGGQQTAAQSHSKANPILPEGVARSSNVMPPAPTYTNDPKMSAYFPRASPRYPVRPPPNSTPSYSPGLPGRPPAVPSNSAGVIYPTAPQYPLPPRYPQVPPSSQPLAYQHHPTQFHSAPTQFHSAPAQFHSTPTPLFPNHGQQHPQSNATAPWQPNDPSAAAGMPRNPDLLPSQPPLQSTQQYHGNPHYY